MKTEKKSHQQFLSSYAKKTLARTFFLAYIVCYSEKLSSVIYSNQNNSTIIKYDGHILEVSFNSFGAGLSGSKLQEYLSSVAEIREAVLNEGHATIFSIGEFEKKYARKKYPELLHTLNI